jgi:hypothetical protein
MGLSRGSHVGDELRRVHVVVFKVGQKVREAEREVEDRPERIADRGAEMRLALGQIRKQNGKGHPLARMNGQKRRKNQRRSRGALGLDPPAHENAEARQKLRVRFAQANIVALKLYHNVAPRNRREIVYATSDRSGPEVGGGVRCSVSVVLRGDEPRELTRSSVRL